MIPKEPPNSESSGCDVLEDAFCSNFDIECCTPCAAETSEYLECLIGSSFLQIMCPGASCEAKDVNMTYPDGNMTINDFEIPMPDPMPDIIAGDSHGDTIDDVGVEAEPTTDDFMTDFCGMQIAQVFGCYLGECSERECEVELNEGT